MSEGIFGYLRALGKEGSDNMGFIRLELPTEIGLRHLGGHSNHLLVTKREFRQRPIVADTISKYLGVTSSHAILGKAKLGDRCACF